MKNAMGKLLPLMWMISIPISNIFYRILNNSSRGVYTLAMNIDEKIPFIKEFIVPYIIWYPFIFIALIYLCIKDRKVYYRTLISLNIGLIICYLIFYFFQTTVVRPRIEDVDIFTKLVSIIYNHDRPYNCFPSVHVITTYIVMRGVNMVARREIMLFSFNIIGILIILSTQFVKQHVILDLIAAIILGEFIFGPVINIYYDILALNMKKKMES
ncbi:MULTISPECIES: phosphatase PAP2 family protein [Clostridium]|jgi:hypothetical protein|uniref:PAP2 superfamily protein n=2 Tax=Clostridium TaxID=1485 RepID=A0A151AMY6_9CLOT|nr:MULTISPECIES: phosphatase PAP2 family protein [Clostridium]KYH28972.1 PAP2 superfamily protein [Clostridium colicanis DSM 13634]PRR73246.1 PAP2 superfamily protein [Clostridium thermopalmarium DSM 5974]PVZ25190.1 PAP2 superfamily protein [Clostridium thermopalmarium DSM 5974]